jgi:acyl dehydratase
VSELVYFEDFQIDHKSSTRSRTVTEADIILHAGQIGDFSPHHVDAEWCKSQPIGQRIAHGTLVLSLASGLTAHNINLAEMSYGYDRVRFIRPTFIGDTLTVTEVVTKKQDHPRRSEHGFVHRDALVTNQDGHPVLAFTHILLVEKRNANVPA